MEQTQLTGQGTRTSDIAPWESYDSEMEVKMSPKLAQEVADYAERRHDVKPSNQSLEELHRQKEINTELSEQYQFLKPEEYEHIAPRIGQVMHPHTFLNKLRRAGIQCWFKDHPHADKKILLVKRNPGLDLEVGCWIQYGIMPEYSIMRFDDHGIPLDERRRGWRTCLLQLILKEAITEEKANKVFGHAEGPASVRFLSMLHAFRNREQGWVE